MKIRDNYQAITTRSHPSTNHKGARISATATAGRIIRSRGYDDTEYNQHKEVAVALCQKFDWKYDYLVGGMNNKGDYVWLQINLTKD